METKHIAAGPIYGAEGLPALAGELLESRVGARVVLQCLSTNINAPGARP